MITFCFCTTFSDAIVRILSGFGFQPAQVMFLRSVVSVLILFPYLFKNGEFNIPKRLWKWYVLRSSLFFIAVFSWLSVIDQLPLPQMYAIGFTSPIISSLISVVWLKERFTANNGLALIGGFIGVMIIIRPGFSDLTLLNLVPLFCAFNWASAMVISKKLSFEQSPYQMTFILSLSFIFFTSGLTAYQWITPSFYQWLILISLGGLIVLTHTCLVRAYKLADLTKLAPFEFMNLVFATAIGWFMFNEMIDAWTFIGGVVIFISAMIATLSKKNILKLSDLKWVSKR